jgi:integrase
MSVYQRTNKKWYCRFTIKGINKHLLCIGSRTKAEANQFEAEQRHLIGLQSMGLSIQELKKHTIFDICKLYDDYAKLNKKSYGRDTFTKRIKEYFGNIDIKLLTPNKIDCFKNYLLNMLKLSSSTVNKYRCALSKCYNLAIGEKYINFNPVSQVSKLREPNHRVRYLTKEEELRLMAIIESDYIHILPIVTMALCTGMRKSEILNCKKDWIDIENNYIDILESKSGKERKIPIAEKLLPFIKIALMDPDNKSEYLFLNPDTKEPYEDIKHSFKSSLKKAQINSFRFHDLRHTVATRMVEKGIDLVVVKEILGHSRIETTMRYAHPVTEVKEKAIDVLNSY